MNTDGQAFLDQFANLPRRTFESLFSRISNRLDVGLELTWEELKLLYDAAYQAILCNIAFNGLGGCGGQIKPDRERNRIRLEREFLAARDRFYACRGYEGMSESKRRAIERIWLTVLVTEENLAW
jgi:hypothetical protein